MIVFVHIHACMKEIPCSHKGMVGGIISPVAIYFSVVMR